jgi:putative Ca2+/H+ antiporter (TMEM165/GDT1 family)
MLAFLVSTGTVAVAEIGDKTQLLTLLLAARFGRPWAVVAGILLATLANHALAGAIGQWLGELLQGPPLRWILGGSFVVMALWALIPDKESDTAAGGWGGAFLVALVSFFLVEMGDKTQVATVLLAARYQALVAVVLGTTLGMMIANVPVAFFGQAIAARVPVKAVRIAAALLFAVLGLAVLAGLGW